MFVVLGVDISKVNGGSGGEEKFIARGTFNLTYDSTEEQRNHRCK